MDDCSSPDQQAMDRRILTLLFADLAGSTELAERLGLEAFDALLSGFHRRAAQVVGRHGGQVLQHYGDGILACFGLAHDGEDAALAGVSAALELVDAGSEHAIRAGMHSGSVLCRGTPDHRQPQITGLDVNLTARLQGLAEPGEVIVSQATLDFVQRLAMPLIEGKQAVVVKGVRQPVTMARVTGLRRLARLAQPAQLQGRKTLLDALEKGGNWLISGPPGLGKSALLQALGDNRAIRVSARGNLQNSPLLPFADWLGQWLAGRDLADAAAGRGLTTDQISALGEVMGRTAPDWLAPAQRRANRIAALARLLADELADDSGLLVFDDLHGADEDSRQVLSALAGQLPAGARMVATSRPDAEVAVLAGTLGLQRVNLPPLTRVEAAALIGDGGLAEDQTQQILDRAEGNPLFLLSLKAAAQGGQAGLPQTIEATLQALINAQGPGKDSLLKAAVIGRSFAATQLDWLGADAGAMEGALRAGLIEQRGEGWRFVHGLLRDAAYHMLPGGRRHSLHQAFALAMEARDPAGVQRFPETLADHYLAAEDGANAPRACLGAGLSFLQRADFDLAIHYLDQAAQRPGGHRLAALTYLAAARQQKLGFAHPDVGAAYALLETEAEIPDGGGLERMVALYGLFAQRMIGGEVQGCHEFIQRMREVAAPDDATQQILRLVNESAFGLYSGRFSLSEQANATLRELYDPAVHGHLFLQVGADPLASILSAEVHIHAQRGDLAAAKAALAQGLAHLDRLGAQQQLPWLHIFGAAGLFFAGPSDLAREHLAKGLALADRQGAGFWQLIGRIWEQVFSISETPTPEGVAALDALLGHACAIGAELQLPLYRAIVAQAHFVLGAAEAADRDSEAACRLLGQRGEGQWAGLIWRIRGNVLLAQGKAEAAAKAQNLAKAYDELTGALIWH
ncbi:adenylate/guanylate cyclase domain-containing protein [Neogemmobacter tilapiae]|uniref:Guanylate cyclase domain-containing protein n=1 Tax=Neogemmobacter tilapiae TaxID=875041 RepID=A0A918TVS8_9RHOB|nr:adenylate/guanylate cyclase domain-containing protein [Gemmobacter tilapiae]GHC64721.1 hypothetical protein GCM10007315_31530 [Gemmobacter tilapiae]